MSSVDAYLLYVIFIALGLSIIFLFVYESTPKQTCPPHSWYLVNQVYDSARHITIKNKRCRFCPATSTVTLYE